MLGAALVHLLRPRRGTLAAFLCPIVLLTAGIATAQEKMDLDAANRIRDSALNHSQIMDMVGYLTDVTGPRLTGSPNLKRAEEYARDKLREWGLENAHLEAWGPFGRGWSMEGLTANVLSPRFSPLIAYPKAWSPGTNGAVRGEVVLLDVKTVADLDKYKGKLKGKIVLFSEARHMDALLSSTRRPIGRPTKSCYVLPTPSLRASLAHFNSRLNSGRQKNLTIANGT